MMVENLPTMRSPFHQHRRCVAQRKTLGHQTGARVPVSPPRSKDSCSSPPPVPSGAKSWPTSNSRLASYCKNVNLEFSRENICEILNWTVEKFIAVLLKGKWDTCKTVPAQYMEECIEASIEFVENAKRQSYFRVCDLVGDVHEDDFKNELFEYGLNKKQLLNQVVGILRELSSFYYLRGASAA